MPPITWVMGAADIDGIDRGAELLLAQCAALGERRRRPVLDRLRERLGAELTRLLVFALAADHKARSRGR
ncbi:MAG: hypothetical protein WBB74_00015 [Gaiellaceae bacterium]